MVCQCSGFPQKGRRVLHSGVIDHDVEPPRFRHGLVHESVNVLRTSQIRGKDKHPVAFGFQC